MLPQVFIALHSFGSKPERLLWDRSMDLKLTIVLYSAGRVPDKLFSPRRLQGKAKQQATRLSQQVQKHLAATPLKDVPSNTA
mmetsp:Transcript_2804/g.7903  ORF Transcript_2804/g.7903 Transcript_2804/m.7903 type:complete len:82 (-) Transcript_2804:180-425(-)